MIIRRKHTANFTTIGNALFNDERLAADEVGVLAFLLSRPHDWEVRRPALARRWRVGRDSIKRIIQAAMRTGWIVARKTRLSNGTFHVIYEVRDEPGQELSAEEVKAALSLVSSGAGLDESEDEDRADHPDDPLKPPTENPSWSAGQPSLAQPSTAETPVATKTLKNTDLQRTESTKSVCGFGEIKEKWPAENVLSEVASQKAFLELTDGEKNGCFSGIIPYLDDCRSQNRKVCDLTTYIRERRWARFAGKPSAEKSHLVVVKVGTPEFYRWKRFKIAHGDSAERIDSFAAQYGGLSVPSKWPPGESEEHAA